MKWSVDRSDSHAVFILYLRVAVWNYSLLLLFLLLLLSSPVRCLPSQIKDIGSGNFGVAWLAQKYDTGETVAIKFIERGENIDENVQREIINHRQLQHRNVIAFRSVALTSTHLAIIMEYAAGGELFQVITRPRSPDTAI